MAPLFEFHLNITGPQNSWTYVVPVRPEPVILGRQDNTDVVLDHQQVSRKHAALHCTETECALVDLNSANGTRLNGKKLTPRAPVTLKHGDTFQIGPFKMEFEQVPLEEEHPIPQHDQPDSSVQPEPMPVPAVAATPPPPELPSEPTKPLFDPSQPPPGLTFWSERLLGYLPPIYNTAFMANFLAIFEALLFPMEWQVDNFDLFLNPGTAPARFLPWLANWFGVSFDSTWDEAKQRDFIKDAYAIFSRSGTHWGLSRMLEIYCGYKVEIEDQAQDLPAHTFRVRLPKDVPTDLEKIKRLIEANKPVHTDYIIE